MKVTYEIENEKKVKVKTYADGRVYKYDEKGNKIYLRSTNGYEMWWEYDANGKMIHHKSNRGFEEWNEYDANGHWIHFKNTMGTESWFTSRTIRVMKSGINHQ